ncbi:MAG: DNA-binding NtrC family response regulator [Planctomycetota bacterium]
MSLFLPRIGTEKTAKPHVVIRSTNEDAQESARILRVEDDPSVQVLIKKQLVKMDYEVESADDAHQASRLLYSSPAFAKIAKTKYPNMRVLFASGYAQDHLEGADEILDPIELIVKPFQFAEFASKVNELLAES